MVGGGVVGGGWWVVQQLSSGDCVGRLEVDSCGLDIFHVVVFWQQKRLQFAIWH